MLRDARLGYEEHVLNCDFSDRTLRAVPAVQTVPQVFVNGKHLGSSDFFQVWLAQREAHLEGGGGNSDEDCRPRPPSLWLSHNL